MQNLETYQWKLRALGGYLDDRGATHVSIIETRGGYAVRYFAKPTDPEATFVHLDDVRLRMYAENLLRRRRPQAPPTPEGTSPKPTYQDFFRALGWELDDMAACNIVLDEQDEGMFLSYASFDPQVGYMWRKRIANLGPGEQQAILSEAYSRRGKGSAKPS